MSIEESMSDSCSLKWSIFLEPEMWDHRQFYTRKYQSEEIEKDWFIQKMRETSAPFLSVLFYFRDKVGKPGLQI